MTCEKCGGENEPKGETGGGAIGESRKQRGGGSGVIAALLLFLAGLASMVGAEMLATAHKPIYSLHIMPPVEFSFALVLLYLSIALILLSCIYSLVARIRMRGSNGTTGGRIVLTLTITLSIILLVFSIIAAPELPCAAMVGVQYDCQKHERSLTLALMDYADEHGTFPAADKWCDAILPKVKDKAIFVCPEAVNQTCSYAINKNLAGKSTAEIDSPGDCILVFESDRGWNASGEAEALPAIPRHGGVDVYGYVDGHAGWVTRVNNTGMFSGQWQLKAGKGK
jgi:hypothetical protein